MKAYKTRLLQRIAGALTPVNPGRGQTGHDGCGQVPRAHRRAVHGRPSSDGSNLVRERLTSRYAAFLPLSKNCSSSVECDSAVVDALLPCTVVVTASK